MFEFQFERSTGETLDVKCAWDNEDLVIERVTNELGENVILERFEELELQLQATEEVESVFE